MAQASRPCDGCGASVLRTRPTGVIPRFCGDDCKPRCSVAECAGPVRKRGWCASHYAQWRYTGQEPKPFVWKWGQGEPRPYTPKPSRVRPECSIEDCHAPHCAHGYCSKHDARYLRNGDPNIVQTVRLEAPVPCLVCGAKSGASMRSRKFCSKPCEQLYYTYGGVVPATRTCNSCGVQVSLTDRTRKGHRRKVTGGLCDPCRRNSWRSQCLSVHELAERDGTDCSICGETVDMTLRRSDGSTCPSIDHVMPRSLGGSNDPENLALAHLVCNIRKSNRIVEEVS